MRERFIRDGSSVRLGNLASDLLRLSKWIQTGHNDEAIVDLMREIAWLMEWSGDLASLSSPICSGRSAGGVVSGPLNGYVTSWHFVHSRCRTGFWNGQDFLNRLHPKQNKPPEAPRRNRDNQMGRKAQIWLVKESEVPRSRTAGHLIF